AFRHFLSQEELTVRFGPTPEAYEDVLGYLQHSGFTLVRGAANRLTLTVSGKRGQAERAFGVHIRDFETGGRRFFANDVDPIVPRSLAKSIQAITGLSNLAWALPLAEVIVESTGTRLAAQFPGEGVIGALTRLNQLLANSTGTLSPIGSGVNLANVYNR